MAFERVVREHGTGLTVVKLVVRRVHTGIVHEVCPRRAERAGRGAGAVGKGSGAANMARRLVRPTGEGRVAANCTRSTTSRSRVVLE